ncbi:MAG: TetR family transcriptional regulator [Alphaproteobacteria bacterium]|nr:TetR family transcriptional regulator [Alphaproteobacteria bacterium]
MARKTKEEALETRNEILLAAGEIFNEKGVSGASLEQIAERAGVTRGAIYWHFKNKMDIFEALHEQLHLSLLEIILQDLETDHAQPLQQLEELCVMLLLDLHRNPHKRRILRIFLIQCDFSCDMGNFLAVEKERKLKHKELFARYFDRAIAKGLINKAADSTILTLSLSCYLTGIVYEYLRNPDLFEMESEAPRLMRQLFAGLSHSNS